jgi:MFS family permease
MKPAEKNTLFLLAAAQFILTLDTTVMNVSISTLVTDLNTTVSAIQSAITFYALVMAAFMIAGAKIGDIIGRKKAFIIGLMIYGVGSLITGLSVNVGMLKFGWSLLEGLGAALIIPAMLALISGNFQGTANRAKAFATIASMAAIGAAVGPIVGGFLTTYASWRIAFLAEVVVVLFILWRQRIIQDVVYEGEKPRFDYVGMFLCATGLATLVKGILLASDYGLIKARSSAQILGIQFTQGKISPSISFIIIGAIVLALFAIVEGRRLKQNRPNLVDLRLLGRQTVRGGILTVLAMQFIIAALMYAASLYMQLELGYSAFHTGVALLPLSVAIIIVASSAGKLAARFSPRSIIMVGYAIMIIGMGLVGAKFVTDPTSTKFAVVVFFIGVGIGLVASQLSNLVLSSVAQNESSETSGLMSTFQNLGSSLGTAIAGATMVAILIGSSTKLVNESTSFTPSQKMQINAVVEQHAAIMSNQALEAQLSDIPASSAQQIVDINSQARQKALSYTFIVIALLGVMGLFATATLPKPDKRVSAKV